jgi:hypothetical protein
MENIKVDPKEMRMWFGFNSLRIWTSGVIFSTQ